MFMIDNIEFSYSLIKIKIIIKIILWIENCEKRDFSIEFHSQFSYLPTNTVADPSGNSASSTRASGIFHSTEKFFRKRKYYYTIWRWVIRKVGGC